MVRTTSRSLPGAPPSDLPESGPAVPDPPPPGLVPPGPVRSGPVKSGPVKSGPAVVTTCERTTGPTEPGDGDGCEAGRVTRAGLDKHPREVARMFDQVAARYDLTNDLLSLWQDRRWRAHVFRAVAVQPGEQVLDLAAGTGTSSEPFAAAGAQVVPCDFSLGMLGAGRRARPRLPFVAGDATRLPFADAAFDAVTISFGLRNVVDPDVALAEMLRVTRPGGRLVVCEFSRPVWRPFRIVYLEYLMRALPRVARVVSSSPDAYVYLADSVRAWPDQRGLAAQVGAAGWADVSWHDLTGGIVALHRAVRPGG